MKSFMVQSLRARLRLRGKKPQRERERERANNMPRSFDPGYKISETYPALFACLLIIPICSIGCLTFESVSGNVT